MEFKETFDEYLSIIEQRLAEVVPDTEPRALYEPFHYLITGGGKRIRPVLTMICAGAVGGDPMSALNPACAIEILHNFTLAHDDIMDQSPLRRGRETVHTKWNEAAAILTGDVMVGYAYGLLPAARDHDRADDISEAFTKGLIEVCEGQAFDMMYNNDKQVTTDDYFMMIGKKTAKIIETSAVIGAHSGHGSIDDVDNLSKYANNLGLAFQLQDDLLDIIAEDEKFGKQIGKDIVEGKKTYLILRTKEKATEGKDKRLINQFFEQDGLSEEYIPRMKDLFIKYEILTDTKNIVEKYLMDAAYYLKYLKKNDFTNMLDELVKMLYDRNY